MGGFMVKAIPAPPALLHLHYSQRQKPLTEAQRIDQVWKRRKAQEPKRNAERLDAWTTKIIDGGWYVYG